LPRQIEEYNPFRLFQDGWRFIVFARRENEHPSVTLRRAQATADTLEAIRKEVSLIRYTEGIFLVAHRQFGQDGKEPDVKMEE